MIQWRARNALLLSAGILGVVKFVPLRALWNLMASSSGDVVIPAKKNHSATVRFALFIHLNLSIICS